MLKIYYMYFHQFLMFLYRWLFLFMFYYKEKKLSFTKTEDVYKRSLQAAKKGKTLTFHWRGGYLTREVLAELCLQIDAAAQARGRAAAISVNWPQAVLQVRFVEAAQPVETETFDDI